MFSSVLVANRGEIACRIISALRSLGVRSVAVYSDADSRARHVAAADLALRIGGARASESYLNIDAILDAARRSGADAIHPGYGFLAENPEFARACEAAGVVFIGPSPHALEIMGDKIRAKTHVAARGVPVVPGVGEDGLSNAELIEAALGVGFPLLIKPSAGGGGKGMHAVSFEAELLPAVERARREAAASFGSGELLIERLIPAPRHIEVQILADNSGHTVHLGERECSLQRRHQKVIEEAPSPLLDPATRARIGQAAIDTAVSVDYVGAGTVEFIVSGENPEEFFFMEMNTRLQVEHPVTEMITGIDLVAWQIRIAAGEELTLAQESIALRGHAIEARVYAEDPATGFLPTGGTVRELVEPEGPGIRVDSALTRGLSVTSDYDPMLAKIIAHGPDRIAALRRLDLALAGTAVVGVGTNVEFLRLLLADEAVRAGDLDTGLIERREFHFAEADTHALAAGALILHHRTHANSTRRRWEAGDGWRNGASAPVRYEFEGHPPVFLTAETGDCVVHSGPGEALVTVDGLTRRYYYALTPAAVHLVRDGTAWDLHARAAGGGREGSGPGAAGPELLSPMPGAVVALEVRDGEEVARGDAIVVIEAMKMEHVLRAPHDGTVTIHTAVGRQVGARELLASITPAASATPAALSSKEEI